MTPRHIFTLPEGFIKDQSVPAHWRIYALMNGFFLNGKKFYATNIWIEQQLGIKQWTISKAISTLEELGYIKCEGRTSKRRVISLNGCVEVEHSGQSLCSPPNLVVHSNQPSGRPLDTADSNAERKTAAPVLIVKDEIKPKTEPHTLQVYNKLLRWAEAERGFKFMSGSITKQFAALKEANKNGLKPYQLQERWEEMAQEPFWEAKGFDWMDVVKSFNKKPA